MGGEGVRVSQPRPPATVCAENVHTSSAASVGRVLDF